MVRVVVIGVQRGRDLHRAHDAESEQDPADRVARLPCGDQRADDRECGRGGDEHEGRPERLRHRVGGGRPEGRSDDAEQEARQSERGEAPDERASPATRHAALPAGSRARTANRAGGRVGPAAQRGVMAGLPGSWWAARAYGAPLRARCHGAGVPTPPGSSRVASRERSESRPWPSRGSSRFRSRAAAR